MIIKEYTNAELRLLIKILKKADRIIDRKCECLIVCDRCKYQHICRDIAQLQHQIYTETYK